MPLRLESHISESAEGLCRWTYPWGKAELDETLARQMGLAERAVLTNEKWCHPDDLRQLTDALDSISPGRPMTRLRLRHFGHTGEVITLDWCLARGVEPGTVTGLATAVPSVSATEFSDLLKYVVSRMDDGFALFDAGDRLLVCNTAYMRVFKGRETPQLVGMKFDDIAQLCFDMGVYNLAAPSAAEHLVERVAAHKSGQSSFLQMTPDGTVERIDERRLPNGFTVCLHANVTELARQRAAALEANNAKSNFLSIMSHEIRTPLAGLLGMLDLMSEETKRSRRDAMLATVRQSGETLLHIVNDVLDVSKIESGQMRLDLVEFDPMRVIDHIVMRHQINANIKGIEVIREFDCDLGLHRLGDPLRFGQIVDNLLANAVKFTERGAVTLKISNRTGREVSVSVSDSGIGMTPEQLTRVMEPFEQADATVSSRFGGTGLGLSIVGQLTELFGGRISVESELHKGSTFIVSLGMKEPAIVAKPVRRRKAETGSCLTGKTVLMADDNYINREILAGLLRKLGLECVQVSDGMQAVKAVLTQSFDAILLDISMPGMGGLEAQAEIRNILGDATPPMVAVTANTLRHQIDEYLRSGFNAHLGKPFRRQDLEALLTRLLHDAKPALRVSGIA